MHKGNYPTTDQTDNLPLILLSKSKIFFSLIPNSIHFDILLDTAIICLSNSNLLSKYHCLTNLLFYNVSIVVNDLLIIKHKVFFGLTKLINLKNSIGSIFANV